MSAPAITVTARCVHCAWRTDTEPGDALAEVRELHELIHPGGTVLVGAESWREPRAGAREPEPAGPNGQRPRGYWTHERIIEALQEFAREHGRSPVQSELRPPLPPYTMLVRLFGSQNAAYEAAGIPTRAKGDKRRLAVPPPTPKPKRQPEGHRPAPVAPAPAPEAASQAAPAGTLAALAQRVDDLSTRRRAMRADLDAVEAELREAIADCAAALDAERLEDSA